MEMQQLHCASRLTSLVCLAALTIGGCGSSYKGLSKADFVNQAVAICTKSTASINTIRSSIGNNPTIGQVKDTFARRLIPAINAEIAQLRALKPPKSDRKTISKMFDDLSAGIDQSSTAIGALKSIKDIGSLTTPPVLTAANKEATDYGLGKCANG
jgi:hypothetical protein